MLIAAATLATLAALLHVFIYYLESFAWTTPRARAIFGTSPQEAEATRAMALNQGYYNLFLALITLVGVACLAAGATTAGAALVLAGTGSMAAAALVLVVSDSTKASAALKQGVLPAGAVLCVVLALVL